MCRCPHEYEGHRILRLRGLSIGDATVLGGHSCAVVASVAASTRVLQLRETPRVRSGARRLPLWNSQGVALNADILPVFLGLLDLSTLCSRAFQQGL